MVGIQANSFRDLRKRNLGNARSDIPGSKSSGIEFEKIVKDYVRPVMEKSLWSVSMILRQQTLNCCHQLMDGMLAQSQMDQ
jgi:hypothetical protein